MQSVDSRKIGRCSGVSSILHNVAGFRSMRCVDGQLSQDVMAVEKTIISSLERVDCMEKFFNLADIIRAGGGSEKATKERKVQEIDGPSADGMN